MNISRLCALLPVLAMSTSAMAYSPRAQSGCDPITFAEPPRVVLHSTEMVGFNLVEFLQVLAAMEDVHASFDAMGGTWAQVVDFEVVSDPFVFRTWYGDPQPTIHVGFTSDPTANPGGTFWDVDTGSCTIREAHIQIQAADVFSWSLMEPSFYGLNYWEEGLSNATGRYFRIMYVHELLHAFGLAHSNDGYGMLNYGDRPWANRDLGDRIMPLPDDLQGLRALYPSSTARAEVAVLNTWFEPDNSGTTTYPAADQIQLCSPAVGDAWADRYDDLCATSNGGPGITEVCPGDDLRVRFTVANYSTDSVDLTAKAWFSTDEVLDYAAGGDVRSPTTHDTTVHGSGTRGRLFEVPTGLLFNREYHVIVKVKGETTAGVRVSDWSPMIGTIRTKPMLQCLSAIRRHVRSPPIGPILFRP